MMWMKRLRMVLVYEFNNSVKKGLNTRSVRFPGLFFVTQWFQSWCDSRRQSLLLAGTIQIPPTTAIVTMSTNDEEEY